MDESELVSKDMWDSASKIVTVTEKGPKNKPIVLKGVFTSFSTKTRNRPYFDDFYPKKAEKDIKRHYTEEDPYGEEDWEE